MEKLTADEMDFLKHSGVETRNEAVEWIGEEIMRKARTGDSYEVLETLWEKVKGMTEEEFSDTLNQGQSIPDEIFTMFMNVPQTEG